MDFLKPMTDEIVSLLNPAGHELVLDIASGTGEPALTIASMLKNGQVIITDLSEGMLQVAKEVATKRKIHNVEMLPCDVCELPFANDWFDIISCRLGFMFFPSMTLAAKEMVRVLKPGGRLVTSVWNKPENNFWITAMMDAINNIELPPQYLERPACSDVPRETSW